MPPMSASLFRKTPPSPPTRCPLRAHRLGNAPFAQRNMSPGFTGDAWGFRGIRSPGGGLPAGAGAGAQAHSGSTKFYTGGPVALRAHRSRSAVPCGPNVWLLRYNGLYIHLNMEQGKSRGYLPVVLAISRVARREGGAGKKSKKSDVSRI
jgi:hypothetical protein